MFKDVYEYTEIKTDILKIKDIYDKFKNSIYYYNISKVEKNKYTKMYFKEYISTNLFFRKYYKDHTESHRSIIQGWKEKDVNEEE